MDSSVAGPLTSTLHTVSHPFLFTLHSHAQAGMWVPSPEWAWQWQQLGGLQAGLLTCALLARFVASLLWRAARWVGHLWVQGYRCAWHS